MQIKRNEMHKIRFFISGCWHENAMQKSFFWGERGGEGGVLFEIADVVKKTSC